MALIHHLERLADSWRAGGQAAGSEKLPAGNRVTALPVRLLVVVMTWLVAGIAAPAAWSATSGAGADRPLRVVTTAVAPFVLPKTAPPAGFSIDLWNEVARRMRVEFAWTVAASESEMLQAVQRGDADVAIAAIAMTPEREKVVDFSHPYFNSGLQILVRVQDEGAFFATLRSIPWLAIGQLFAAAFVIIFLLANVLWLIERRRNKDLPKSYLLAIGECLWGTMLIIATGTRRA